MKQLKNLVIPLTFLMVSLNITHLKDGIKNVKLQLTTQLINFLIIPFLALAIVVNAFGIRVLMRC